MLANRPIASSALASIFGKILNTILARINSSEKSLAIIRSRTAAVTTISSWEIPIPPS